MAYGKIIAPRSWPLPQAFARDPALVWRWYNWRRGLIAGCRPNPAHEALAAGTLERAIQPFCLITQNVDGLHRAACSRELLELHGSIWNLRCTACGAEREDRGLERAEPPICPDCGGVVRPGVVWFGESLDPDVLGRAYAAAQGCRVMIVAGTSALVQPAAGLARLAKQAGAFVIEINLEATPNSSWVDVSIRGKAGEIPASFSRRGKSLSKPIITLTTDFGPGPHAGLMKGVILSLVTDDVHLVDLSHAVPAQNVRAGALFLEMALGLFPAGTVHLAVVDPGVGTERRPVCVQAAGQLWVGPDNGLFTPAYLADPGAQTYLLAREDLFRRPISHTFHGRDIFAPAAAHLAMGRDPAELGPMIDDPVLLEWPEPSLEDGALRGVVLGADGFGNLGTNLKRDMVRDFLAGRPALVRLGGAHGGARDQKQLWPGRARGGPGPVRLGRPAGAGPEPGRSVRLSRPGAQREVFGLEITVTPV